MVSREYLPWDSEYAYALVRKATQRHELPDANYLRLSTAVCGRRDGWCGGQTGQTPCESRISMLEEEEEQQLENGSVGPSQS
jgi:hypothetical protein